MNRKEIQIEIKEKEQERKQIIIAIDQLENQIQLLKQRKRIITGQLFKFKRIDLTLKSIQDELEAEKTIEQPSRHHV